MSMSTEDDLLSSVLSAYHLRAGVYGQPRFCGQWQHGTAGMRRAAFHWIGEGQCWLHLRDGSDPTVLEAGDLVVFPHDAWHLLAAEDHLQGDGNIMPAPQDGPYTTLVCGYFDFELGDKNPVLDAMPEVLLVRRDAGGPALAALGALMLAESDGTSIGTRTVLDKLADTLFVMAVRHHVNSLDPRRGMLAALADPRLRNALSAIHRDPGADWTLNTLADIAGISRSGFARHFSAVVGVSPIDYLIRWRMTRAELALRNPQISVATVAEQMGYETEAAFRKAFKRVHGIGPGALRRWIRDKLGSR